MGSDAMADSIQNRSVFGGVDINREGSAIGGRHVNDTQSDVSLLHPFGGHFELQASRCLVPCHVEGEVVQLVGPLQLQFGG